MTSPFPGRFDIRHQIMDTLAAKGFSFVDAGGIMIAPYKTWIVMQKNGEAFRIEIRPVNGANQQVSA